MAGPSSPATWAGAQSCFEGLGSPRAMAATLFLSCSPGTACMSASGSSPLPRYCKASRNSSKSGSNWSCFGKVAGASRLTRPAFAIDSCHACFARGWFGLGAAQFGFWRCGPARIVSGRSLVPRRGAARPAKLSGCCRAESWPEPVWPAWICASEVTGWNRTRFETDNFGVCFCSRYEFHKCFIPLVPASRQRAASTFGRAVWLLTGTSFGCCETSPAERVLSELTSILLYQTLWEAVRSAALGQPLSQFIIIITFKVKVSKMF